MTYLPTGKAQLNSEEEDPDITEFLAPTSPNESMPRHIQNENSYSYELPKQMHNLREILLSTNATPIRRCTDKGYVCCYCDEQYMDPSDLKTHTLEEHDDKTKATLMEKENIRNFLVKLDITSLKCRLCDEALADLEELNEHLESHGKQMYTDIKKYILPFEFANDSLKCAVCENKFTSYKSLQMHTYTHYKNFECTLCGAGFVNRKTIDSHYSFTHRTGIFRCAFCPKTFETKSKKKNHETSIHEEHHKCGYCDKRFKTFDKKRIHLAEEHDVRKPVLKCKSCSSTFLRQSLLSLHVKKVHLREKRYKCAHCGKAFFFEYMLADHVLKHTNVKKFKCEICFKYFARKRSLREHVKIHVGDRKFRCVYCDTAFVQKCSLKNHLRTKHDDFKES